MPDHTRRLGDTKFKAAEYFMSRHVQHPFWHAAHPLHLLFNQAKQHVEFLRVQGLGVFIGNILPLSDYLFSESGHQPDDGWYCIEKFEPRTAIHFSCFLLKKTIPILIGFRMLARINQELIPDQTHIQPLAFLCRIEGFCGLKPALPWQLLIPAN